MTYTRTFKKNIYLISVILILFLGAFKQPILGSNDCQPVVISPEGSDLNPGTIDRPMATLEAARDLIRESDIRENEL